MACSHYGISLIIMMLCTHLWIYRNIAVFPESCLAIDGLFPKMKFYIVKQQTLISDCKQGKLWSKLGFCQEIQIDKNVK